MSQQIIINNIVNVAPQRSNLTGCLVKLQFVLIITGAVVAGVAVGVAHSVVAGVVAFGLALAMLVTFVVFIAR